MKSAVALFVIGAALFALPSLAQTGVKVVPPDQCSACKWMMDLREANAKRGITDQQVLIDSGCAWFFYGKSAADSKWLQGKFAEFNMSMAKPDVKLCEDCAAIGAYVMNPKSSAELVPTKTGLVFMMTSTDKAANDGLHVRMKKLMEMSEKAKASKGMSGCCDPSTSTTDDGKFAGKGDGITTCPVTGEAVDKSVSAKIDGKTVYFCCAGCVAKVKVNPSKYLKK